MDAGTAVGVVGAFALPLLTQWESLGRPLRFVFAALAVAAVAGGLLLGEAALCAGVRLRGLARPGALCAWWRR
ncbi:hypothetical protein OHT52_11505 [Streptomyces sp. NBC_00247]|uniref:hypothetical protein n=1 Tax=Streptomyces sp. NBC_00247 TaxID=2975689 RepID=UPI002E2A7624|nr:hypothetical protein [Streptomyces sp. NBC_00247]